MVAAFLQPWRGTGIRHIPANSPFGILDTRFAGLARDNRWNESGAPTFYVASDLSVAIAEFSRHMVEERDASGRRHVQERAIYRLDVHVQALLDLRDPKARRAIGLEGGEHGFLDVSVARATAGFLRRATAAEALLVPSMAFLDNPARWNLVLFLEKLPRDLSQFITATYDGVFRVEP
ncbi:MAG: RES family NAD+ phosphorylase [Chloroflexota bacterium]